MKQLIVVISISLSLYGCGQPDAVLLTDPNDFLSYMTDNQVESYLRTLDLSAAKIKRLEEGNTTKKAFKVKMPSHKRADDTEGETVAVIKCTDGNTYHKAEVAAYELGKRLGFNIFPVTVERTIHLPAFGIHGESCMIKEWLRHWASYYWKAPQTQRGGENTFTKTNDPYKRTLARALNCRNPLPSQDTEFVFSSKTRFGHPQLSEATTQFLGRARWDDVLADFSNMMVFDALIGNNDRFPGGNLQIRSSTQSSEIKNKEVHLLGARLFSLDNGASFKNVSSIGFRDLITYVSRFDPKMLLKLKQLKIELEEQRENPPHYLRFTLQTRPDISASDYLIRNIRLVLSHVDKLRTGSCPESSLFL